MSRAKMLAQVRLQLYELPPGYRMANGPISPTSSIFRRLNSSVFRIFGISNVDTSSTFQGIAHLWRFLQELFCFRLTERRHIVHSTFTGTPRTVGVREEKPRSSRELDEVGRRPWHAQPRYNTFCSSACVHLPNHQHTL